MVSAGDERDMLADRGDYSMDAVQRDYCHVALYSSGSGYFLIYYPANRLFLESRLREFLQRPVDCEAHSFPLHQSTVPRLKLGGIKGASVLHVFDEALRDHRKMLVQHGVHELMETGVEALSKGQEVCFADLSCDVSKLAKPQKIHHNTLVFNGLPVSEHSRQVLGTGLVGSGFGYEALYDVAMGDPVLGYHLARIAHELTGTDILNVTRWIHGLPKHNLENMVRSLLLRRPAGGDLTTSMRELLGRRAKYTGMMCSRIAAQIGFDSEGHYFFWAGQFSHAGEVAALDLFPESADELCMAMVTNPGIPVDSIYRQIIGTGSVEITRRMASDAGMLPSDPKTGVANDIPFGDVIAIARAASKPMLWGGRLTRPGFVEDAIRDLRRKLGIGKNDK